MIVDTSKYIDTHTWWSKTDRRGRMALPANHKRVAPLSRTHEEQVRGMWKNILAVATGRRGTTVYDTFGTFLHATPESIKFLLLNPSLLAMERGNRAREILDRKVFIDAYLSSASAERDNNYPSVVMEMSAGGTWVGTSLMVVRNSGLLVLPQIWPLGDDLRQVVDTMARTKGIPALNNEQRSGDVLAVSLANAILASRGSPWELTAATGREFYAEPVCVAEYGKEGLKTYRTFTRTSAIYVPFRTPAFSPLSLESTAMSALAKGAQGVPSHLSGAKESQQQWSEPQRIGDETTGTRSKSKPKGHHPHKTFLHSALSGKSHAETTQKLFASQAAATREREPIGARWRHGGRWRGGRGWFSAVAPLLYPPPPPVVMVPPPPVVMVPPPMVPLPYGMPPEAVLYDAAVGLPPGWMLLENNYRIPIGARYPRNMRVLRREPRHRPPVREEQHEAAAPRPEDDPEYISKLREMQRIGEDLSIIRERIAKRAESTPQKP